MGLPGDRTRRELREDAAFFERVSAVREALHGAPPSGARGSWRRDDGRDGCARTLGSRRSRSGSSRSCCLAGSPSSVFRHRSRSSCRAPTRDRRRSSRRSSQRHLASRALAHRLERAGRADRRHHRRRHLARCSPRRARTIDELGAPIVAGARRDADRGARPGPLHDVRGQRRDRPPDRGALAVFIPVFINTLRGLRQVQPVHRDLMRAYAATVPADSLARHRCPARCRTSSPGCGSRRRWP